MLKMYEIRDSKDNNLYSLEDMVEMYEEEPVNYSYVSKRLCCPHCQSKKIKIQIDDYFERITSRKADHESWCDYAGNKLSQREIKKLLSDSEQIIKAFNFEKIGSKVFPKRNIERYLSADDFEVYKLFYGTVTMRTAHSKDEGRYRNFAVKAPKGEIINISFGQEIIRKNPEILAEIEANLETELEIKFIAKLYEVDDYVNAIIEANNFIEIKVKN